MDASGLHLLWAWLAIWLAGLWAGVWEWFIVAWWLNAILRNPEMKSKIITYMVLFIALTESVAIYWLIVALQILDKDPSIISDPYRLVAAWLAIWIAGIWVGIWEWYLGMKAIQNMGKNPELNSTFMVLTILGMALTESAAIYWLVVALQLLW